MILRNSTGNRFLNPVTPTSTVYTRSERTYNTLGYSQSAVMGQNTPTGVSYRYDPTLGNSARFVSGGGNTGTILYRNDPGLSGSLAHENIHARQQVGPRGNLLQEYFGAVPRMIAGNA